MGSATHASPLDSFSALVKSSSCPKYLVRRRPGPVIDQEYGSSESKAVHGACRGDLHSISLAVLETLPFWRLAWREPPLPVCHRTIRYKPTWKTRNLIFEGIPIQPQYIRENDMCVCEKSPALFDRILPLPGGQSLSSHDASWDGCNIGTPAGSCHVI